jgi:TfoX/Sxy family transcriptional regulator of competence genes
MNAEMRFASLVEELAGVPGVEAPGASGRRTFGSTALKVDGSIFAMVSGGRLVVKLPRDRVGALIGSGSGLPFDGGKERPMKEWVAVAANDEATWVSLAREALDFVRSRSQQA